MISNHYLSVLALKDADNKNYDWKTDRTLVGRIQNLDGTTTTLTGPKSGPKPLVFVAVVP